MWGLNQSSSSFFFFCGRGMPLYRMHDRNRKWRLMEEDESVFVYREGTLDQAIHNHYHFDKNVSNNGSNRYNPKMLRNQVNNSTQASCLVALKDIIVWFLSFRVGKNIWDCTKTSHWTLVYETLWFFFCWFWWNKKEKNDRKEKKKKNGMR